MSVRRLIFPVLVFMTIGFAAVPNALRAEDKKDSSLGEKVLAFCEQHKGEQVGNGECATLAGQALKAAGAKRRGKDDPKDGDYTWGDLIFTIKAESGGPKGEGKRSDIRPGDVIQFRDAKFFGKRPNGKGTYSQSAPHHTAIVQQVDDGAAVVKIYHQNFGGKKIVQEMTLRLNDLQEGWLRFYRPVVDPSPK
jgi:hypothetical protein